MENGKWEITELPVISHFCVYLRMKKLFAFIFVQDDFGKFLRELFARF